MVKYRIVKRDIITGYVSYGPAHYNERRLAEMIALWMDGMDKRFVRTVEPVAVGQ